MRILPVNANQAVHFSAEEKNNKKRNAYIAAGIGAGVVAVAIYKMAKKPKAVVDAAKDVVSTIVQEKPKAPDAVPAQLVPKVTEAVNPVIKKEEFLSEISKLKEKDYTYSPENMENFGFTTDLHMHTIYSDGKMAVPDLLDEVSSYADDLFKRTQRKFMFSITDHDSMEGVKEALEIISQNPQKFRNVRFVPGVELSFVHEAPKSTNPAEVSEVLAYGLSPEKFQKYYDALQQKRHATIDDILTKAKEKLNLTDFDKEEFLDIYGINPNSLMMNVHWHTFHYAQTKHALTIQAARKGLDAKEFYANAMKTLTGDKNVYELKKSNLLDADINEEKIIDDIRKAYDPKFENGKLNNCAENSLEDIIKEFKGDDVVFSFAHPFYTAEKFEKPSEAFNDFIKKSDGLIQLTETYHQAYPAKVGKEALNVVNGYLDNLTKIGGSDNHQSYYILKK